MGRPSYLYHRKLLTDRPFHLQLDQPVQLNRVLQRDFLRDWLDEAVDYHRGGFVLGDAARHQVE